MKSSSIAFHTSCLIKSTDPFPARSIREPLRAWSVGLLAAARLPGAKAAEAVARAHHRQRRRGGCVEHGQAHGEGKVEVGAPRLPVPRARASSAALASALIPLTTLPLGRRTQWLTGQSRAAAVHPARRQQRRCVFGSMPRARSVRLMCVLQ
jgi:hypothetical protein